MMELRYPTFGGLTLIDPEEEERRRRTAEAIESMKPTAAMAPPPEMPGRPQLSALLSHDRGMDDQWRAAERNALAASGRLGEQSYGVAEGVRDFAPMAIGGVLDVLLNKGRGLGALTGGGMQALSMERGRRQTAEDSAMDQALAIRRQREAYGDTGIQAEHARLRGEELSLSRDQLALARDRLAKQGMPPPVDAEMRAAELRRMNAQAAEAEARAGRDPNALTPYEQAQLEGRDLDRQERAATRAERGEDRALARDAQAEQRAYMAEQREAARVEAQRNKFRDETERMRPQVTRAMEVEDIVRRAPASGLDRAIGGDGKDIPGVGWWDSTKPGFMSSPEDIAMRGNLTDMADLILRERSGAAAPPIEVQKLAQNIAAGGGITEREFAVLQAEYSKLLKTGLQQQAVGREDIAREVLGSRADWALGPRAPQATAPADPPTTFRAGSGRAQALGQQPMPGGVVNQAPGQLPYTDQRPRDVIRVDEYLQRLRDEDDDLGVRYR